ncbi:MULTISPECIES: hypothetical protein [unclassified Microcoleus]
MSNSPYWLILLGRVSLTSIAAPILLVNPTLRQGMNSLSHSESPLKEN